jgi:hypothetical protein
MELYNGLQFLIMKYIITESRLDKVIFRYLDSKLDGVEAKKGKYYDIVLAFPGKEYGLIGWKPPNQLFSYHEIVDFITSMFLMDKSDALDVIGRYVESKYNLKVGKNTRGIIFR